MSTRTYSVYQGQSCQRVDNLLGPHVNIPISASIPAAAQTTMCAVQTDPLNSDKVFACGYKLNTFHGLAVSSDAGQTWQVPGGNYTGTNGFWPMVYSGHKYNLWVVNSNVIYVTNDEQGVIKSLDGGLTFNYTNANIPSTPNVFGGATGSGSLQGIHFINPLQGIVGGFNNVFTTTDGGDTWNIHKVQIHAPGLDTPGFIRRCYMSPDGLRIVLLGETMILRSIDGGATFSVIVNWNKSVGLHMTWWDDNNFFVFGKENIIMKSTNGGATWSYVTGHTITPSGPKFEAGHFYAPNQGFYDQGLLPPYGVQRTIDGCVSVANSFNFSSFYLWTGGYIPTEPCYQLTPCAPSQIPPFTVYGNLESNVGSVISICAPELPGIIPPGECLCFTVTRGSGCENNPATPTVVDFDVFGNCDLCGNTCYKLEDCANPQHIIYTQVDLSAYVGHAIHLAPSGIINPDTCWLVSESDCKHPMTPVIFQADHGIGCVTCSPRCWKLTNCRNPQWIVIASTDFSAFENMVAQVHYPEPTSEECWTITLSDTCRGAIPVNNDAVEVESCECCMNQHYLLTDCNGELPPVITCTDLSDYVGLYVNFTTGGTCWLVTETTECSTVTVPAVLGDFQTCEECTPVVPPVVIPNNIRSVKPGYDTPGCDPEYTEKVNCKFANAIYNQMTVVRYGIKMCCDLDVDKWSIKKSLLDMKAIYDPTACCTVVEPPCCPECPPTD